MYISVESLFFIVLSILGGTALVFLIILLNKAIRFFNNVNKIIESNEGNIDKVMKTLPDATDNVMVITENVKDVSEVATAFTADIIDKKECISDYFVIAKDIFAIVKDVFIK